MSTGKKVRKDEQLGSKRVWGSVLPLADHSAPRGGREDAWSVRLTLGTRMGTRACRALPCPEQGNIIVAVGH